MSLTDIENLFKKFQNPEYFHGILGDFVGWGLFFGLIFLIAGSIIKVSQAQMVALGLMAISSLAIAPANKERIQAGTTLTQTVTPEHTRLYNEHTQLRAKYRWVYYVMAALAIGGIALRQAKMGPTFIVFTYIWGVVSIGWSAYLHTKEVDVTKAVGQLVAPENRKN
jgi:hypothetical protein